MFFVFNEMSNPYFGVTFENSNAGTISFENGHKADISGT